ncbi:unnamed protein product [Plutella xylostella]|uniref:Methylated-DNA--protein-cysteine methyltransferase n=1 Tax=Plutella xylostella TaxID=51655 RepID=A0A8S4DS63_PLUXY|nr:unnamed protein product [Plutella xylostella]
MVSKIFEKYSKSTNTGSTLYYSTVKTPVGNIIACASDEYLYLVAFEDSKNLVKNIQAIHNEVSCSFEENSNIKVFQKLKEELALYFNGSLKKFTVPCKTLGSEFQKEVWKNLQELPYSTTMSYGDFAKTMGRPASHARAVGSACGANAHLLVIPCHRLVASGSKGGFNSGKDRKEWLIDHEKKFSI